MNDYYTEKYEWNVRFRHPNYASWDPQPEPPVEPKGLKWRCGDPKKRRALIQRFSKATSLHGMHYVCTRRKAAKIPKIIYRIIFVFCFLSVISNVSYVIQEAFGKEAKFINNINKDMKAGLAEDPDFFPKYPTITVCRKPPFRVGLNNTYKELVEYVFLSLGFPFVSVSPKELTMIVALARFANDTSKLNNETLAFGDRLQGMERRYQELKSREGFDLTRFVIEHSIECNEFFSSCFAMVYSVNCCDIFHPILTSMGMCYTMHEADSELVDLVDNGPLGMPFVMDLPSPLSSGKEEENGFYVFLTDPLELVTGFEESEGQKVIPGVVTTVSVHLVKRQRTALHTAWHGLWDTCPTLLGEPAKERYTMKMCGAILGDQNLKSHCKCRSMASSGISTENICEPKDMYSCITAHSLRNNLSDHLYRCEEPCIAYKYRSGVSYMGLGSPNISRIQILYNSKQYVYLEYRTATISNLFSQIGGCLGLYLGASIITVVEILTFAFSWLWLRIRPSRIKTKAKNPPEAHANHHWPLARTTSKFMFYK